MWEGSGDHNSGLHVCMVRAYLTISQPLHIPLLETLLAPALPASLFEGPQHLTLLSPLITPAFSLDNIIFWCQQRHSNTHITGNFTQRYVLS